MKRGGVSRHGASVHNISAAHPVRLQENAMGNFRQQVPLSAGARQLAGSRRTNDTWRCVLLKPRVIAISPPSGSGSRLSSQAWRVRSFSLSPSSSIRRQSIAALSDGPRFKSESCLEFESREPIQVLILRYLHTERLAHTRKCERLLVGFLCAPGRDLAKFKGDVLEKLATAAWSAFESRRESSTSKTPRTSARSSNPKRAATSASSR